MSAQPHKKAIKAPRRRLPCVLFVVMLKVVLMRLLSLGEAFLETDGVRVVDSIGRVVTVQVESVGRDDDGGTKAQVTEQHASAITTPAASLRVRIILIAAPISVGGGRCCVAQFPAAVEASSRPA